MPYVITTKTPDPANGKATAHVGDPIPGAPTPMGAVRGCWPDRVTRRAVATLEEAREGVSTALWENGAEPDSWRLDTQLSESGGTVGPLPDGTVIEVAPMTRDDVVRTAGESRYIVGMTEAEMVDAYNARA